jgi:transcription elongation factor Elf1
VNLLELLRSQARRFRCPVCGESMADCGIKVLAHQGNRALVRVTCASCNDENLLQIVIQTEAEVSTEPPRPKLFDEPRPEHVDPIDTDEVLDLHSLLAGWRGNLRELVGN